MAYTDIWNEAYDILKEHGGNAMLTYVYGQRDSGSLNDGDVSILIEDMRDFMVEVVDGRDAHKVPERNWVIDDAVKGNEQRKVFCIKMGGKYIGCANINGRIYLCAEYKTENGVRRWMEKNA